MLEEKASCYLVLIDVGPIAGIAGIRASGTDHDGSEVKFYG